MPPADLNPNRADVERYAQLLFEGSRGTIEVRTFRPGDADWKPGEYAGSLWATSQSDLVDRVLAQAPEHSVSVGLGARKDDSSGSQDNVAEICVLVADIDVGPGKDHETLEAAHQQLATLPIVPTMTVESGGGLHVYWRLGEPLAVADPARRQRYRNIVLGLAIATKGDRNVRDTCRLMGCPGTVNRLTPKKIAEGRQPALRRIIEDHPDRRYSIDEFAAYENLGARHDQPVVEMDLPWGSTVRTIAERHTATRERFQREADDLGNGSDLDSRIDLSLASKLAGMKFSADQIDQVVAASRRGAGLPDRSLAGTIEKALNARPAVDRQRPAILQTHRDQKDVVDEMLHAVEAANRGGALGLYTRGVPGRIAHRDTGEAFTEALTPASLGNYVSEAAHILSSRGNGFRPETTPPNRAMMTSMLALPAEHWWRAAPCLDGISQVPIVRPDGSIHTEPGYDATTRFLYEPAPGLMIPELHGAPGPELVAEAVVVVDDLLAEFPFADEASRANVIAGMLTPIVRPAIEGPTPPLAIDAPTQGSGKGLISDLIAIPATGRRLEAMTLPDREEEIAKSITSLMIESPTVVRIDNVGRAFRSDHLASLFTGPRWRGRVLGLSQTVELENRSTWIITGNNLVIGGDHARRIVYIRIDPPVERPWERTGFRHPNLVAYTIENRGHIVWALLTLVRAWAAAGCPGPSDEVPQKGSFEDWRRVVGGILEVAGVEGFLGNSVTVYEEVATEDRAWRAWIEVWWQAHQDRKFTTSELSAEIQGGPDAFREAAPEEMVDKAKSGNLGALGWSLRKRKDNRFGPYILKQIHDSTRNHSVWQVVSTADEDRPDNVVDMARRANGGRSTEQGRDAAL